MSQYVVVLSGPEKTRAKVELALEDAHLPIFPSDHHAVGRQSYKAEHWSLPAPEGHGYVAVLANEAEELNRAVSVVEKHDWVLRVHYHVPPAPKPDPLAATIADMQRKIAELEGRL